MSLTAMAARCALRTAQDASDAPRGKVVLGIQPLDQSFPDATVQQQDPRATVVDSLGKLTAWIPTEAIVFFGGAMAAVQGSDSTSVELLAAGLTVVLVVLYSVVATIQTHASLFPNPTRAIVAARNRKAILTSLMATVAFLVWWAATPGSAPTTDLGIPAPVTVLILLFTVGAIPQIAKLLRLEPLNS